MRNLRVKIIDKSGLDDETVKKIETEMLYVCDYTESETTFAELKNSKGEIIRIFHERFIIL